MCPFLQSHIVQVHGWLAAYRYTAVLPVALGCQPERHGMVLVPNFGALRYVQPFGR